MSINPIDKTDNGAYVAMSPTSEPFMIGRYTDTNGGGNNFFGTIDEPRVWDKAMTQEEIISAMSQECKAGSTGQTLQCNNDVVGVWNFDDGVGSLAADGSRNRNNGRLNNVNVWATNGCQFGGCLNLDGSATDYVEIPDNSSLDVSNEATVMLWANIENIDTLNDGDDVLIDKQTSDPFGPFGILLHNPPGLPDVLNIEGRFVLETGAPTIYLRPNFQPPINQWLSLHHF